MTDKTPAKGTRKGTAATTKPKATKATTAKPARNTLGTFDATKADTHKCSGACGKRLPVKKFPTITGTTRRVAECRSCRDERTRAAKSTLTSRTGGAK